MTTIDKQDSYDNFSFYCLAGVSFAFIGYAVLRNPKIRAIIQKWLYPSQSAPAPLIERNPQSLKRKDSLSIEEGLPDTNTASIPTEISPWKPLNETINQSLREWKDPELIRKAQIILNEFLGKHYINVAIVVQNKTQKHFIAIWSGEHKGVFISHNCISSVHIEKGAFGSLEQVAGKICRVIGEKTDFISAVKTFSSTPFALMEWNGNQSVKGINGVVPCLARMTVYSPEKNLIYDRSLMFPFFQEGDLFSFLEKLQSTQFLLEERLKMGMYIFKSLSYILKSIHEKNLVYNDLKLENTLIKNGRLFFTDFSNTNPAAPIGTVNPLSTFLAEYLDVLDGNHTNLDHRIAIRKRIDVRQLAFLIYIFLTSKNYELYPPYPITQTTSRNSHLWPDTSVPYVDLPEQVPLTVRSLIRDILDKDPSQVPDIQTVCQRLEETT